MPPLPKTIEEVLSALDEIIESCLRQNSYLAIFAYVYRRTTAEIRTKILENEFEDSTRMENMDVVFANLFIRAYRDFQDDVEVSRSWKVAFDRQNDKLAILQHLLLGMNAHINLDLAIATSEIMEGKPIDEIGPDFRAVNDILAGITNEVQDRLSRVSPLLFLLDWIGQRNDEKLADFSIVAAREQSWLMAIDIWENSGPGQEERIRKLDISVARFGTHLAKPELGLLRIALRIIAWFESRDKKKMINAIREG